MLGRARIGHKPKGYLICSDGLKSVPRTQVEYRGCGGQSSARVISRPPSMVAARL
jgi:hypothetical protein